MKPHKLRPRELLRIDLSMGAVTELRAEAGERGVAISVLCAQLLEVHTVTRREEHRRLDQIAADGAQRSAHA